MCLQDAIQSKECFEWHPASCHDSQHCLHVCWHLRHIVHVLLDRVARLLRDRQGLRPHSLCVPHKAQKFLLVFSLCGVILNYTTNNKQLFSSMAQSQTIGRVKQKPDINCQTTWIVSKSFLNFFWPTQYMSRNHPICECLSHCYWTDTQVITNAHININSRSFFVVGFSWIWKRIC